MHDTDLKKAEQMGHEPEGIDARAIWAFAAALVATVVLTMALTWFLLRKLVAYEGNENIPPAQQVPRAAGAPNVDANQIVEVQRLRELEADLLNNYEWVDSSTGVARIPIDRAMAIVAEKGLQAANAAEADGAPEAMTTTEAATGLAPAAQTAGESPTSTPEQPESENDQ